MLKGSEHRSLSLGVSAGELLGAWAVEDADDGRDEESFADLEDGVDSSRMESCCWRMTRSRCWTKLTATVLAMWLAAGS